LMGSCFSSARRGGNLWRLGF